MGITFYQAVNKATEAVGHYRRNYYRLSHEEAVKRALEGTEVPLKGIELVTRLYHRMLAEAIKKDTPIL